LVSPEAAVLALDRRVRPKRPPADMGEDAALAEAMRQVGLKGTQRGSRRLEKQMLGLNFAPRLKTCMHLC